jgi:hypothetical protein
MGLRLVRGTGLAILLATGLTMSACSSTPAGAETASKIVPKMQAAAESATSVHIAGSVTQGSKTTTIDASFSGVHVAGSVGVYGTSFYVLSLAGAAYVKLNPGFLKVENAPANLCATICGKYVELPGASAIEITELLSMQQIVNEVFSASNLHPIAASGCLFTPAVLDGQSVLECHQGAYALAVAAHGRPYLVYWGGPHGQHLAFSDWNSVTLPPAPSASQVVDVSALG